MHPISAARTALARVLAGALGTDIDVLDWYDEGFSKGGYVRLGETRADVSQETFATQSRLQFGEYWTMELGIGVAEAYANRETFDGIMGIADTIMTTLAKSTTLGGVAGLVWCKPTSVNVTEQDRNLVGTMELSLRFRVNRR